MAFCLVGGTVFTPLRALCPGVVVVEDGRIIAVGDEHLKVGGGVREIDVSGCRAG